MATVEFVRGVRWQKQQSAAREAKAKAVRATAHRIISGIRTYNGALITVLLTAIQLDGSDNKHVRHKLQHHLDRLVEYARQYDIDGVDEHLAELMEVVEACASGEAADFATTAISGILDRYITTVRLQQLPHPTRRILHVEQPTKAPRRAPNGIKSQ